MSIICTPFISSIHLFHLIPSFYTLSQEWVLQWEVKFHAEKCFFTTSVTVDSFSTLETFFISASRSRRFTNPSRHWCIKKAIFSVQIRIFSGRFAPIFQPKNQIIRNIRFRWLMSVKCLKIPFYTSLNTSAIRVDRFPHHLHNCFWDVHTRMHTKDMKP